MSTPTFRVLAIDDTPGIHDDYRKVLCAAARSAAASKVSDMEALLFGVYEGSNNAPAATPGAPLIVLDSAMQGREGVEMVAAAVREGKPYSVALVDMRMPPGWDGVQTIRELWKIDPELQVVICTAYSDYTPEQISRELTIDGRVLMLRKPFDATEVRQVVRTLCDKWQARQRNNELERLIATRTADFQRTALTDTLTGLPNRALFNDRLESAFRRSRRDPEHKFAVLFLDADRFKMVNDSLGHEAGDALLLQIAERLTESLRDVDTVSRGHAEGSVLSGREMAMAARLGGDEFTIILENLRADADAARVAQRLLEVCSKPYELHGHTIHSTFSIGIANNTPAYTRSDDVLRDADTAMYHAKREGRGRFAMFDRTMHKEAIERLQFENDLRTAVAQRQICLHYQPIIDMKSERLIGFEALARWQHPTRGWVGPAEFIPVAEEIGAIIPLGFQVIEEACRQLKVWQSTRPGLADLTMSINLSRKQLDAPDLVERIGQIIDETGVDRNNVKIEITESSIMSNAKAALAVLCGIRDLGVQLQIDDFGTGYSSLSCLQTLPVSGLKIDRDFIKGLSQNPEQATIIRTIIALAHALGIPLVAEGVETSDQNTILRSLGCDQAQGYMFAKPMDPAAVEIYLDSLGPRAAAVATAA
jgi:diguanylate cyclase